MQARRRHLWEQTRATFWFVPGVIVVGAIAVATVALAIDTTDPPLPGWFYAGGAEGARNLLSTVASSMATVAGVGFSITIVALVLASTQFGPRLLTLFMRDLTSQWTLGMFAGTFTYCILVLRAVRGPEEPGPAFVPELAITIALGMTLASVATLVYFFHHVAVSISAPRLVAAVAHDLDRAIDHLSSEGLGQGGPAPAEAEIPHPADDAVVHAHRSGYVEVVDDAAVLAVAASRDLCVRLLTRPGLFVIQGTAVVAARPRGRVDGSTAAALDAAVIIGDVRTAEDDIEFSVRQLVEVATRALSPAVNDPFTAMAAIDWLGAALARLAVADFPSRYRYDDAGRLRVVADVSTFGGIAHTIFSRLRYYAGSSPVVLNRLLEAVAAFGPWIRVESDRQLVRDETEAVLTLARTLIVSEMDLAELKRRHRSALAALDPTASRPSPTRGA